MDRTPGVLLAACLATCTCGMRFANKKNQAHRMAVATEGPLDFLEELVAWKKPSAPDQSLQFLSPLSRIIPRCLKVAVKDPGGTTDRSVSFMLNAAPQVNEQATRPVKVIYVLDPEPEFFSLFVTHVYGLEAYPGFTQNVGNLAVVGVGFDPKSYNAGPNGFNNNELRFLRWKHFFDLVSPEANLSLNFLSGEKMPMQFSTIFSQTGKSISDSGWKLNSLFAIAEQELLGLPDVVQPENRFISGFSFSGIAAILAGVNARYGRLISGEPSMELLKGDAQNVFLDRINKELQLQKTSSDPHLALLIIGGSSAYGKELLPYMEELQSNLNDGSPPRRRSIDTCIQNATGFHDTMKTAFVQQALDWIGKTPLPTPQPIAEPTQDANPMADLFNRVSHVFGMG